MPGTKAGSIKMMQTMREKLGGDKELRNWFAEAGSIGGKVKCAKGFGSDKVGKDGLSGRERSRIAGRIGGKISRRRGQVSND